VVSGINAGSNLGDDVIYSGTVAAAMEGRFLGLPAVAFSMTSFQPKHWPTAALVAKKMVENILAYRMPEEAILNVNIPDLPIAEIRGFEITRLGNRHKAEPAMVSEDPRGKPIYWVGAAGPEQDAGPGTDFYAINNGFVSISPIHVDLTRYSAIDSLNEWLVNTKISL
jgi:5'-nucleotidase